VKRSVIDRLNQALAARRPVAFAKRLKDGVEFLLPDTAAPMTLNAAGAAALAADRSRTEQIEGESWFIEARNPPPRLVIIGAVHIAQALVPFATMTGFVVTLVDPRRAFAAPERFPETNLIVAWPGSALAELQLDASTAVVALSHDPKLDDPALDCALRSDAFYIGALGSRKSQAARLERLRLLGHPSAMLARIRGPVGLDIGAVTATEIALSVIGEIVSVRRQSRLSSRPE
jgi:xanthine dehydrogenase accessory factor